MSNSGTSETHGNNVEVKTGSVLSSSSPTHNVIQSSEVFARLLWKLTQALEVPESRKALSSLQSDGAQLMVDFLYSVLLERTFPTTWLRKHSLIALYKLSKASLLYPHCYILKDIIFCSYESGGAFSDVHKGQYGEQDLCLKVIRLHQKSDTETMLKIYAKEAILWGQLHHPNIAPFYGIYYLNEKRKQVCLVSPWMRKGNLVDYLKNNPSVSRPPFVHDVATGLEYLHSQNLIHGDIKGMNILVNDSERACITDFGLSSIRTDHTLAYSIAATTVRGFSYRWAAPELLEDGACATLASDVWAFGCVCYEVLTGLLPFHGLTDPQVFRKLMKGELPERPSGSSGAESAMWELVDRCWNMEPADRPTCQDISQELKQKGLTREQVDDIEVNISQGRQTFLDAMRKSEQVSIDLNRVEQILDVVRGFPQSESPSTLSIARDRKSYHRHGPGDHLINTPQTHDPELCTLPPQKAGAATPHGITKQAFGETIQPQVNQHRIEYDTGYEKEEYTRTPPSTADQSTSLYQQCSSLRARLMRIRGFSHYLALATTPVSLRFADPVTELWDLFSIGISLCYIFDQLPAEAGFSKINHSEYDQKFYESNPDREKKHAIALFVMQIRTDLVTQAIPECEPFTVRDVWDRSSTEGLVKVIKTVTAIVVHLPPSAFDTPAPSLPPPATHVSDNPSTGTTPQLANTQEQARNNIIYEMVEAERRNVRDLETMQRYSNALAQRNLIDQDTIDYIFPNINKILDLQRKHLIHLESTAEVPWQDQQWGLPFIENEDDFTVYEIYCANYTNASELLLTHAQSLMLLNHIINVEGELLAFLYKPIQRVCNYPRFLDSLIKTFSPTTYPHYEQLEEGLRVAKRIIDAINEAQRRADKDQIVKSFSSRVDDWKGLQLENFGDLLLNDIFTVTKSDIDREYHVFLFKKIILLCKEVVPAQQSGSKIGKNISSLKRQAITPIPFNAAAATAIATPNQRRDTRLLLKGRILLRNVTRTVSLQPQTATDFGMTAQYSLVVWWKGEDGVSYFILKCRNEEQMREWESQCTLYLAGH